jgi:hypothetical protein
MPVDLIKVCDGLYLARIRHLTRMDPLDSGCRTKGGTRRAMIILPAEASDLAWQIWKDSVEGPKEESWTSAKTGTQ